MITYGFPVDLTQDALREQVARSIWIGLQCCRWMRKRPKHARRWSGSASGGCDRLVRTSREIRQHDFLGYGHRNREGADCRLDKDGRQVTEVKQGDSVQIALEQTTILRESGRSGRDTGMIQNDAGFGHCGLTRARRLAVYHIGEVTRER